LFPGLSFAVYLVAEHLAVSGILDQAQSRCIE
jgi:hypothetical protein